MAVLWWNGFGRSTTARRPAMNDAPGWLGTAPVPGQLRRAERGAQGRRQRHVWPIPCRPHRPRVVQPVARNDNEPLHSHPAPSPNHPAATGVSGDGTRNVGRGLSAHGQFQTIHGRHCAVIGIGSDTPRGRQPRVSSGVDIVDLVRVCEWAWAGFRGIEAVARHAPAIPIAEPRHRGTGSPAWPVGRESCRPGPR